MYRVLALIKRGDDILGLRILAEGFADKYRELRVYDWPIQNAIRLIKEGGSSNVEIINNRLECKECSLNRLPILNEYLQPITPGGIFIITQGKYTNETLYDIVNTNGQIRRCSEEALIKYVIQENRKLQAQGIKNPAVLINGKLVSQGNRYTISAIKGNFREMLGKVENSTSIFKPKESTKKFTGIPMKSLYKRQLAVADKEKAMKYYLKRYYGVIADGFLIDIDDDDVRNYLDHRSIYDLRRGLNLASGRLITPFGKKYLGDKYSDYHESFKCGGRKCVSVSQGDYSGIADLNTGKLIIPCWFDRMGINESVYYDNILQIKVIVNRKAYYGFIDIKTGRVTDVAYERIYFERRKNNYITTNMFTGETVDIREVLKNSTAKLNDLLAYVPVEFK